MEKFKKIFISFSCVFSIFLMAQKQENSLEVEFQYLSKARLNKTNSYITEEIFLLQVLKNKAFFFSENMAKNDSILRSDVYRAFVAVPKGQDVHIMSSSKLKSRYGYVVLQTGQENQYFEKINGNLYTYKEDAISNWKLVDESQIINTLNCKKATLNYKGRNWIAWYDEEIPLPFGPYKFTGLPGLVIKVESEDGDFSFELVKSIPQNKLNDKELSIQDSKYKNAKPATFEEIRKIKKNNIERLVAEASDLGVSASIKDLHQMQKEKLYDFENENLIDQK